MVIVVVTVVIVKNNSFNICVPYNYCNLLTTFSTFTTFSTTKILMFDFP